MATNRPGPVRKNSLVSPGLREKNPVLVVGAHFKLFFVGVVVLTVLTMGVCVWLTSLADPTPFQYEMASMFKKILLGLIAFIVGLLGARIIL